MKSTTRFGTQVSPHVPCTPRNNLMPVINSIIFCRPEPNIKNKSHDIKPPDALFMGETDARPQLYDLEHRYLKMIATILIRNNAYQTVNYY